MKPNAQRTTGMIPSYKINSLTGDQLKENFVVKNSGFSHTCAIFQESFEVKVIKGHLAMFFGDQNSSPPTFHWQLSHHINSQIT